MCVDSWLDEPAFYYCHLQAKDKHGITPLLAAIWEGHTECVSILLRGGADKNGSAPDGTAYKDAAEKDEIKVLISWIPKVGSPRFPNILIYPLWFMIFAYFYHYKGVVWVVGRPSQTEWLII